MRKSQIALGELLDFQASRFQNFLGDMPPDPLEDRASGAGVPPPHLYCIVFNFSCWDDCS